VGEEGERAMNVAGLMLVRDEADILAVNLNHHLRVVDRLFVIDNGSSDETPEILRRFAHRFPQLSWTTNDGPYLQSKLLTQLAHEARAAGAEWVVSIDADEFWRSNCNRAFTEILGHTPPDVGAYRVPVINFVQARWVERQQRRTLLTMTRRSPSPVGPPESAAGLVANRHTSYVEAAYAPKLIARTTADLSIGLGNHSAEGLAGEALLTEDIVCLHAPLRSRDNLLRRAATGDRVENDDFGEGTAWQPRRWAQLTTDELDAEWRANSYSGFRDMSIDVYGYEHPLVLDTYLRETVLPHYSLRDRVLASLEWRRHLREKRG
jgi:glycosyltransferase involved in cell wall biosynthesis